MKKKFNSLIIIRKSSSEIDWIIPVMEKMNKSVKFYTLFLNQNAYESLKKNNILFKRWQKISKNYYVQNRIDRVFFKILKKILGWFSKSLEKQLAFKIHDLEYLKRKLKIKNSENLHFILNEFQKISFWANSVINKNSNTKLFLFPHTTHIYKYSKKDLSIIKKKGLKKECDAVFLGNKLDIEVWKSLINKNNIYITGHPKYDSFWQRKFDTKYKKIKKNNIIFALKNITDEASYKSTLYYLKIISKIVKKNNYFLTIKLPPYPQKELIEIINSFSLLSEKKYFSVSNENIFKLLKNANILINFNLSATSLDALSNGVPVIQLPAISKLKERYGKNDSIYTKLKLAFKVSKAENLEKKINYIFRNKLKTKKYFTQNYYKYFPKNKNSSETVSKIILDKISLI